MASIEMASANINWIDTLGARIQAPAKIGIPVPTLKISLVEPLSEDLQNQFKTYLNKCLYPPKEAINDAGDEILLKEPPSGGFKRFLKKANDVREICDNK